VIPLIAKNVYDTKQSGIGYGLTIPTKKPAQDKLVEDTKEPDAPLTKEKSMSVEEEAMELLLKGEMPILAQNTIPGLSNLTSDKEKYMHDLSLRPKEMELEDYDRVPVEAFGAALLRGMGWKEGNPVGKNPNGYNLSY
jgi:hypothetical protein